MNAFTIGLVVFFALLAVGAVVTMIRRPTTRHDAARHQAVTDEALYRHGPPNLPGAPGGG